MRVLYDISTLGLAQLYRQSRGGSYRAELHVAEGLAASPGCDLLFCANHSTVAFHGSQAFLRDHPRLGQVPLVAARSAPGMLLLRAAASRVHRRLRSIIGTNVLPAALRGAAAVVDRRVHPPVGAAPGVDILHTPSTPLPPGRHGRSPRRFLTIYDLSYVRFPGIYGASYERSTVAALRSVEAGDHVITASAFVRDELCDRRVAPPDRIHIVPLAAHPALFHECTRSEAVAAVRARYGVPDGPYVLSVNSPDPRKNVPHAIQAFARAAREDPASLGSLVLAGNAGPGLDRINAAIAEHCDLAGRIILTGYVRDEDLAPLYTGALFFVYPSRYEGFGLPPLEAMQCGTPVVTSNTSSLPEVVSDGGVMVPPDDVDALAAIMLDLARCAERRAGLQRRALARARTFSWDRSTAATLRAYRSALEDSSS
jgi:glycosyltransferase involved in cell wall biosynthesis